MGKHYFKFLFPTEASSFITSFLLLILFSVILLGQTLSKYPSLNFAWFRVPLCCFHTLDCPTLKWNDKNVPYL